MAEAEADLRAGRWITSDPGTYLGLELSGATFGIVGLGRIGRRHAELVTVMAGEILYTSRIAKADAERELGAVRIDLGELFRRGDVVSLHLPATPETVGLVGRDELRAMKPHAVLVNTARGPLVDATALAEALREGEIGAAGLNAWPSEPVSHR